MKTTRLTSPRDQLGLSLLEVMISLTIGFLIVAAVGYLYLGSRQSFRTQDNLTTIQENARYALETMSHDIRMAGYMGCGNLNTITPHVISNNLTGVTLNPGTAVQVFPAGSGWTAPAGLTITAKPNTDILRIYEAAGGGVPLTGNMGVYNANIQIGGNPYNFQKYQVLMVSDCIAADVFTATSVSSASGMVTIAHSSSNNSSNFLSRLYGATPPPAFVYVFTQNDYLIGCPTASYSSGNCSVPWALYRIPNNGTAQPLISNVEKVAYQLGVDTSGTTPPARVVGAYQSPSTVAAANNWNNVLSVQVHLLLVGGASNDSNSNVTMASQHYTFNGSAYTAPDRRMYQEAVTTVAIRNRL